ncbi:hypothetical protein DERP_006715 [Dermatophagoides pteronyssinus]|uniref:Uncharacterized protein n=1 Tax=Dermatophagoides pteronyssinus TaxID=6956 RepID=A0ABQ8IRT3_DERPT|nr:hypothetical protein DERP_006715 [Dermatophagoides pteronyssinus]
MQFIKGNSVSEIISNCSATVLSQPQSERSKIIYPLTTKTSVHKTQSRRTTNPSEPITISVTSLIGQFLWFKAFLGPTISQRFLFPLTVILKQYYMDIWKTVKAELLVDINRTKEMRRVYSYPTKVNLTSNLTLPKSAKTPTSSLRQPSKT